MIHNLTDEPLKVKDWNSEKPITKHIDYSLGIVEDKHWIQLGMEIDDNGNVRFIERYIGSMP